MDTQNIHCMSVYAAFLLLLTCSLQPLHAASSKQEWEATKMELDEVCEQAREVRLSADIASGIEECMEKGEKEDRAACERSFAGYGAGSPNTAPLYYDLPECQRAFEHRQSQRNRDYRQQQRNQN